MQNVYIFDAHTKVCVKSPRLTGIARDAVVKRFSNYIVLVLLRKSFNIDVDIPVRVDLDMHSSRPRQLDPLYVAVYGAAVELGCHGVHADGERFLRSK